MILKNPRKLWEEALEKRKSENSFRQLRSHDGITDFSSNDYLGFSGNRQLQENISLAYENSDFVNKIGSTGSRLISGHHRYFEEAESFLAQVHNAEATLLFNSGYVANLAVFSTLPQKGDTVLYDELCHASIKDGIRLSYAERFPFLHNDLNSLEGKLKKAKGNAFVAVESVYSMDGNQAPLVELVELCNKYNAQLIVDEAHSTGTYGKNGAGLVCELGLQEQVPVRIYTFGKAMGCHGAAVCGEKVLKDYLINFARPFIFTTAMSLHSVISIIEAYKFLKENPELPELLKTRINKFKTEFKGSENMIKSESAIQAILFPGNENARNSAAYLQKNGFDVRPILSPTVKKGTERLRICLHTFNADNEINSLYNTLKGYSAK